MKPSAERIRELIDYDPLTGVFLWKHRPNALQNWNTKWAGKHAGSPHSRGYIAIAIDHVKYLAHHLAWVYMTGEWPTEFIDHENLNKKDNKWENLRLASFAENSANASIRNDNKSGFRGVYFVSSRQVWHAKITKEGKDHYLGAFDCPELAAKAYAVKARELYGEYCPQYLRDAA
jgi:hypothetical protein